MWLLCGIIDLPDLSILLLRSLGWQTGGNFGGFQTLSPRYYDLSYPIAAVATDGTSVIQKHPDQNGMYVSNLTAALEHMLTSSLFSVTTDTVRGQFLYEIQGSFYYNPDVIADITSINFEQIGKDLVQVSGVKGERGYSKPQCTISRRVARLTSL